MDTNSLIRETGLAPETVRTRCKLLAGLSAERRAVLDVDHLSELWKTDRAAALDFLWCCARTGWVTARWQQFSPATGWVLDESADPGSLVNDDLNDPFDRVGLTPDLGKGGRVVFSHESSPYSGVWSDYAAVRHIGVCPEPTRFQVLKPREVAKLTLEVAEAETYHVVCLENRSHLVLRVDSAQVTGGRSFIGKMKQYRAQKFLLSLQRRVIDLKVTPTGLVTEHELIAPGQLVYWLENATDGPVMLQVWKSALPVPVPVAALSAAGELFVAGFRRWWSDLSLAPSFARRMSGMTFLTADFSRCSRLFAEVAEADTYQNLQNAWARVATSVEARSGRVVACSALEVTYAFPGTAEALGAALELRHGFSRADSPKPAVFLTTGTVLLVDQEKTPAVFGYPPLLARLFQAESERGDLWLSTGFYSTPGVAERLSREHLETVTEMLGVPGQDRKTLAYRLVRADA